MAQPSIKEGIDWEAWDNTVKGLASQEEINFGSYALQDYQMQLIQLEQQNKERLLATRLVADEAIHTENHALQDYPMQLMLQEQQNKGQLTFSRKGSPLTQLDYSRELFDPSGQPSHWQSQILQKTMPEFVFKKHPNDFRKDYIHVKLASKVGDHTRIERDTSSRSDDLSPEAPGPSSRLLPRSPDAKDSTPTVSRITNSNGRWEHWITAYVNDIKVVAFPDNCSALNIISMNFARQNKLPINHTMQTTLRLPNQSYIKSCGSVGLDFRFDGETTTFHLIFTVLPSCVCNILLSSNFLRFTKTFTTFKSRIQSWFSPTLRPRARVCLQGTPKHQVTGFINGHFVSASPDTGSDVNVISREFAKSIGLDINTDIRTIEILEFIDGSSMNTCGIIYDVEWRFGTSASLAPTLQGTTREKASKKPVSNWEFGSDAKPNSTFICNFYVLEGLSCPVILCADLLYGTNAFTACADLFYEYHEFASKRGREDEGKEDVWVLMKKRRTIKELFFKSKTCNGQSSSLPVAQNNTAITEARRRMDEQDRIAELPLDEQSAALEAEQIRVGQWAQENQALPVAGPPHHNATQTNQQPALQSSVPQAIPPVTASQSLARNP